MNAYPSDEQVVSNKQVVVGECANLRGFKLPKNASEIKAMLKFKPTHYN